MIRVGTITPTLGARNEFLDRSRFYMEAHRQTLSPVQALVVNYPQVRFPHDLTDRYRRGLETLKDRCDLAFFIEDDDYYPPNYLELMTAAWRQLGKPDIFGIGETYFFHPQNGHVWYRKAPAGESPCAYQMCIRTDALEKIDWSMVDDLFTDVGLWRQLKGVTVTFGKPISIGIKHGKGICGAGGHNLFFYEDQMRKHGSDRTKETWAAHDPEWLRSVIGDDAGWYGR